MFYVWHSHARKLGAIGVYYGVVVPVVAEDRYEATKKFLEAWDRLAGQPNVSERFPTHLFPNGLPRHFHFQEAI
jgi:hypothetical protein